MKIAVIDGQGGQLGSALIKAMRADFAGLDITAVGTNSAAAAAMLKAGADRGATGENPVLVACRHADIIVGPIGIVMADSMLGEITPRMALSVARSAAAKVLIPSDRCHHFVAGVEKQPLSRLLEDAVEKVKAILGEEC